MSLPRILITGASGFIGRHLLEVLKEDFEIIGLARRSQVHCGAPIHKNITWNQVDIADREALKAVFRDIRESGGAQYVMHLAAHYDFTGEDHPEYYRTNVDGLRNVLDLCRRLRPRCFIFSSSTAACLFPEPGQALTENSVPDGDHIYYESRVVPRIVDDQIVGLAVNARIARLHDEQGDAVEVAVCAARASGDEDLIRRTLAGETEAFSGGTGDHHCRMSSCLHVEAMM